MKDRIWDDKVMSLNICFITEETFFYLLSHHQKMKHIKVYLESKK